MEDQEPDKEFPTVLRKEKVSLALFLLVDFENEMDEKLKCFFFFI